MARTLRGSWSSGITSRTRREKRNTCNTRDRQTHWRTPYHDTRMRRDMRQESTRHAGMLADPTRWPQLLNAPGICRVASCGINFNAGASSAITPSLPRSLSVVVAHANSKGHTARSNASDACQHTARPRHRHKPTRPLHALPLPRALAPAPARTVKTQGRHLRHRLQRRSQQRHHAVVAKAVTCGGGTCQ